MPENKIPDGLRCEVTPEQVYENIPPIPEGYECIGFDMGDHPAGCWALDEHGGRILARDLIIPRIIVRRKPEPHVFERPVVVFVKPYPDPSDPSLASKIAGCERCGNVESHSIHIKPAKPRRWLVECHPDFAPQNGRPLQGSRIREVKPITRAEFHKLCQGFQDAGDAGLLADLHEIGIEVED